MEGFIKVKAVEGGITCETHLSVVSLMERVEILNAIALGLELKPWMVEMFLDMWRAGKFTEPQEVDDHPPKPCSVTYLLEDVLKEVFGGES